MSSFSAPGVADPALNKPRPVEMGLTRLQLSNRMNQATKAKRMALLLTSKPIK